MTAPEHVNRLAGDMQKHMPWGRGVPTLLALAVKLAEAEAERDAALDALEPFSSMAGVLFAMNYELSDEVFSIEAKYGEVAMTFEAFLNARAAARQKGGEG